MKRKIRLTESDLHKIVKESVNNVLLKEWYDENGKYLEGFVEIIEDFRVRLIDVWNGFGEFKYRYDLIYNHSIPYNKHIMEASEYVRMALKELYQAKQDFMDESNSKQQPSQP